MSLFTWLDYSEDERRKAEKFVDMFRQQDTVDELGLGVIRDIISDEFFPGTSTIQTRARYFFFIPWIHVKVEESGYSGREAKEKAKDMQNRLRNALVEGGEEEGVIGFRAKLDLKRLASSVYWNGMRGLQIFLKEQQEYDYFRSLDAFYDRKETWKKEKDENYEANGGETFKREPLNWDPLMPDPPKDYLKSTNFNLTKDEGDYLLRKISEVHCKSLLNYFIQNKTVIADAVSFPWEHPLNNVLMKNKHELGRQLILARGFSEIMHGASLLYNLILSEMIKNKEYVEEYRERIEEWWDEKIKSQNTILNSWDYEEFYSWITSIRMLKRAKTWTFIKDWHEIVTKSASAEMIIKSDEAKRMIKDREQMVKPGNARTANSNALKIWNGDSGSKQMDFRWGKPVKTIINEIIKGINK